MSHLFAYVWIGTVMAVAFAPTVYTFFNIA